MTAIEQAQFRKQVYDYLQAKGFKLSETTQKELSALLKSVYEKRIIEVKQGQPIKHEVVCPKCEDVREFFGYRGFKTYLFNIRQAKKRKDKINNPTLLPQEKGEKKWEN